MGAVVTQVPSAHSVTPASVTPASVTQVAPGIFYAPDGLVCADDAALALLKASVGQTPQGRARICAHPDPGARQQDMLIAVRRGSYVRPHRHKGRSETLTVLEGRGTAFVLTDAGTVEARFPLVPVGQGGVFFYRMPAGRLHTLIVESDLLVFLESTIGPFDPATTDFADWAPADPEAGRVWMDRMADPSTG